MSTHVHIQLRNIAKLPLWFATFEITEKCLLRVRKTKLSKWIDAIAKATSTPELLVFCSLRNSESSHCASSSYVTKQLDLDATNFPFDTSAARGAVRV